MVHNTNITHVNAPGGNYENFIISGQDTDYLPFWMKQAGYRVEYIGKFLNGYSQKNYNITSKGWNHVDSLVDPYTYVFSTPVMSLNGQRPVYYEGYYQSDVIRAKALDRVDYLTSQDKLFYLTIAPSTPHVQNDKYQTIPLSRHANDFENVTAPRSRNWNPADEYQQQKGSWLATMPQMNDSVQAYADHSHRQRIRVRGPSVPAGVTSKIPGAHLDLVPTFTDIAGVPEEQRPPFLDGSSLLPQWHNPKSSTGEGCKQGNAKETLNVEFWGLCTIEAPNGVELGIPFKNNSYKSLRIVGEDKSWLYSYWCTGHAEFYNTAEDPYELDNLAINPTRNTSRLLDRLNTILLVIKSCAEGTCRQPWTLLQPGTQPNEIVSLAQAMNPQYDGFFAKFPKVAFKECLQIQDIDNEMPFYPALPATGALGQEYPNRTDNYQSEGEGGTRYIDSPGQYGSWEQRNASLAEIEQSAREITDAEIYGNETMEIRRRDLGLVDNPEWMQWIE